jgi:hypothetical protein
MVYGLAVKLLPENQVPCTGGGGGGIAPIFRRQFASRHVLGNHTSVQLLPLVLYPEVNPLERQTHYSPLSTLLDFFVTNLFLFGEELLERWDGVMWTGLVWLRIGTGGELL